MEEASFGGNGNTEVREGKQEGHSQAMEKGKAGRFTQFSVRTANRFLGMKYLIQREANTMGRISSEEKPQRTNEQR